MKKKNSAVILCLVVLLIFQYGCGRSERNESVSPIINMTEINDVSEWPENEYTSQIPVPEVGSIYQIMQSDEDKIFAVFLENVSSADADDYIQQLTESGYQIIDESKESTSHGALLSNDDIYVSIAASDTGMVIQITMKK